MWFRRPMAGVKCCGDASGPTGLEVHRQSARRRWQQCMAHRGDHVYAVTPLRGESRMIRLNLWSTRALTMCTTAGAIGTRLSPRPCFSRGRETDASLGRTAPRGCGRICARCLDLNTPPLSSFSPCGRRWREAPDEGSLSADTGPGRGNPSPVTNALRAFVPPFPTRGEGRRQAQP